MTDLDTPVYALVGVELLLGLWALGLGRGVRGYALPGYRRVPFGYSDGRKAPFCRGFPQSRRPSLQSLLYVTF